MDSATDSSVSLDKNQQSANKKDNIKVLLTQIAITFLISLTHVPLVGVGLGYSAVFIAQIDYCKNITDECNGEIFLTETERSWFASIFTICIPIGALLGSTIVDAVGTLNLILLGSLPGIIGWVCIAIGNSYPLMLVGRALTGIALSLNVCPTLVYISEISNPLIRGSMSGIPTVFVSLGVVLCYVLGYYVHWRVVAWICVAFTVPASGLSKLLPQSPMWLISKGKICAAENSLRRLYHYHSNNKNVVIDQLANLIKMNEKQQVQHQEIEHTKTVAKLAYFLEPTVYKPMLILTVLNIFTQFSGMYVVIFYAATLFEAAGTNINPYLAAIWFGCARLFASILSIGFMQRYGRRSIMTVSGLGMTVAMIISGLFTKWIQEGTTTLTWIPLVMIIFYTIATVGFLIIPIVMASELFPTVVRGMAQSITLAISYGLTFASIRTYYVLNDSLGGAAGLQFFFALMSIASVVCCFIFLPETRNKNLHEIGEYFKHYFMYVIYTRQSKNVTESTEHIA